MTEKKIDLYDHALKQWKRGRERGEGIPALVYDTIVYTYGEDYRPLIIKKHLISKQKEHSGIPKSPKELIKRIKSLSDYDNETWFFVINLPAGLTFEKFKSLEQTFADALGEDGTCQIEQKGRAIHMTVSNVDHKRMYDYEFDPEPYLKKGMLLPFPIGYSIKGLIVKDLSQILTCLLVGMMGSGKSNIEHVMIYALLSMNKIAQPPYVIPVVLDPKLGEFSYFEQYGALWGQRIEHIEKLLKWVNDENDRRAPIINKTGSRNFVEFLQSGNKLPFIVVFCDEIGELSQSKEAVRLFNRLLHQGRSQGIITVGAIQRPSAVSLGSTNIFSEIKAMCDCNIVYRVRDVVNSQMVLDNPKAAFLPKKSPGRCIFSWDEEIECQSMYFPSKIKDPDRYNELLSRLPQYPQPYENIQGEVYDYAKPITSPKVLLPRYKGTDTPRTMRMLEHRTNPFT
jgi:hypothetical protein